MATMSAWIKAEKTGEPGASTLVEKGETERRFGERGWGYFGNDHPRKCFWNRRWNRREWYQQR
jgi:hypothetical protein